MKATFSRKVIFVFEGMDDTEDVFNLTLFYEDLQKLFSISKYKLDIIPSSQNGGEDILYLKKLQP